jgi:hypothetical protein
MAFDPALPGVWHHIGFPEKPAYCPITGRVYERGAGCLSHEEQSANFLREMKIAGDMPRSETEVCPVTGRLYQMPNATAALGAQLGLTRSAQTIRFTLEGTE